MSKLTIHDHCGDTITVRNLMETQPEAPISIHVCLTASGEGAIVELSFNDARKLAYHLMSEAAHG